MNVNVKKFNNLFITFIIFILFVAIYNLYLKHNVSNDSTISEWLINYQGGFTRRGIIGEICFQIAKFLNFELRDIIFFFQSIMYVIFSYLIISYIKNVPKNVLTIIAIFSPVFLFYPVAEIEVLARKEIFLYVGFIFFLKLCNKTTNKDISLIYVFFIFPILCLIWEPFIFFVPFALFIVMIQHNLDSLNKINLKIIVSFLSPLLTTIFIIKNLLPPEGHEVMKQSLMDNFNERCYMSCALLKSKSNIAVQFQSVAHLLSFEVIFRYSLIIFISFFPILFLYNKSKLKSKIFLFQELSLPISLLLLPSLILFSSGTDWGRWINITYTFTILLYLYLIKNDLIIVKDDVLIFDNYLKNNKKIFCIIFFIFAFYWNPKTSMTGDVATNSLYKVIYNNSKKLFKFEGIYLFQDSPLIKFHKRYIE
jgi:hypothetical protein